MQKNKGFSLIELLIVVAIILIIAAIAIPNLLRSKISANESSAVASVRTLVTAQMSYVTAYPSVGFSSALSNLGTGGSATVCGIPSSTAACLIDPLLATGTKSGYTFYTANSSAATAGVNTDFYIYANPVTQGTTGVRTFCAVTDGVVRYVMTSQTTCAGTETPLQ